MYCLRFAVACAVFLSLLPSARGANAGDRERAARKACLLGDVKTGTEILADLYLDTKDPTYIYNQGRCFEQNGQDDQALLRFREYLRKAKALTSADAEAVRKRIDDLQAATATRAAPQHSDGSAVPTPVQSGSSVPHPDVAPEQEPPRPIPHADEGHSGRGLRIAGVATVIAGAVACGAGIAFELRARSKDDQSASSLVYDPQLKRDARTLAYASFAVGGAAIVTGAILAILGWTSNGSVASASDSAVVSWRGPTLGPLVGRNLVGLASGAVF
jgi:hypothetical protein